jgi:recombinational DNA repair protein (RecF pathway)
MTNAYLHESFFALRYDVVRFYAACAMAEICLAILYENEKHEGLFVGLAEGLKALSLSQDDPAEALLTFVLTALRESGYPLDLGFLEECGGDIGERLYFDFADGRFTTFERAAAGERASLSTYYALRKCAGLTYREDALAGGNKRALRLVKAYLSEKTESKFDNLGELIRLYEE